MLHGTVATKRILNLSPLPFLKGKPLPFSLPFFSFILPHPLLRARLLSHGPVDSRPNSARPSSADIARAIHHHCAPAHMHQYRRISLQPEACSTIMHNHFNRRQTAIHMLNHAWIITKNIQMYIRSSHTMTQVQSIINWCYHHVQWRVGEGASLLIQCHMTHAWHMLWHAHIWSRDTPPSMTIVQQHYYRYHSVPINTTIRTECSAHASSTSYRAARSKIPRPLSTVPTSWVGWWTMLLLSCAWC